MYDLHDYVVHGLIIIAALAQILPATFVIRLFRLTGYARYWSESWIVFIAVMFWVMARRVVIAYTYDPTCELTNAWIFDQAISPIVTSIGLTAVVILQNKFYTFWLDTDHLKFNRKRSK